MFCVSVLFCFTLMTDHGLTRFPWGPAAMTTPTVTHGYVTNSNPPSQPYTFDTTGQIAPPGAKPRVTATLWEDEGSLCYQVEAKGVCVARREGMLKLNPPPYSFEWTGEQSSLTRTFRQPYDQWNEASERCWDDPRPPRRHFEERENPARGEDWPNAFEGRVVRIPLHLILVYLALRYGSWTR
jgi:hypothetical protein